MNKAIAENPKRTVQKGAEELVLKYLMRRHVASVRDICKHFDLARSTMTNVLKRLMDMGYIAPAGAKESAGGRPSHMYRLCLDEPVAVVRMDMRDVDAALVDENLEIVKSLKRTIEEPKNREEALVIIREVMQEIEAQRACGLALWFSAVVLDGRVQYSSILPWLGPSDLEYFEEHLGVPIYINFGLGAAAEYPHVPPPLPKMLVLFGVSEGLSALSSLDGEVNGGVSGLAGELGHVTLDPKGPLCKCGRKGCLEAMASGPAIREKVLEGLTSGVSSMYLDRDKVAVASAHKCVVMVQEAWKQGDTFARSVMVEFFDRMAWGLGIVINLMDPDVVVFSGYVVELEEWQEEIRRRSENYILHAAKHRTRFLPSQVTLEDEWRALAIAYQYEYKMS